MMGGGRVSINSFFRFCDRRGHHIELQNAREFHDCFDVAFCSFTRHLNRPISCILSQRKTKTKEKQKQNHIHSKEICLVTRREMVRPIHYLLT